MDEDHIKSCLQEIASLREGLRVQLGQISERVAGERPASGKWSILENVRHLLFAEQAHMSRLFRDRPAWSPAGYTPEAMRAARRLPPATPDGPTLGEVWDAWDSVHLETVRRFSGPVPAGAEVALTKHLRHLRAHVSEIEKLLRQVGRR